MDAKVEFGKIGDLEVTSFQITAPPKCDRGDNRHITLNHDTGEWSDASFSNGMLVGFQCCVNCEFQIIDAEGWRQLFED
jgi:hypothetical protein